MNMKYNFSIALVFVFLFSCSVKKSSSSAVYKGNGKKEIIFNKEYIDETVKANEDFFMFANGSWVKNNPVPPSESRWGSFNELEKSNQEKLKQILDDLKAGSHDPKSEQYLLASFYTSYLEMDVRNKLSFSPIKSDLSKINSITNYTEISSIVAEQHKYGVSSLFSFRVRQDMKDVTKNVCYVSQSGLGLPNKDYYISENKKEILKKYLLHVETIFKLAGYDEKQAKTAAGNVLKMETNLAERMKSPAELRIPEENYNKFKTSEAELMLNNFDFEKYLSSLESQTFEEIIVGQPAFVKNVNKLIKDASLEEWKDYLSWKTLRHYSPHLDEKFIKADFDFYQGVLSGKSEMKPLHENAINDLTRMSIGQLLGKFFVEKHFSENAKIKVNTMVDNLLLAFNERIKNLTWMTDSTKIEALHKLNSIGRKLGFPSKWEDFTDLALSPDNYIDNVKQCARRDVKENLKQLYLPIDKEKWGMPPHMVNAYYSPLLNEIAFPAGIMQFPFFEEKAEDALNYGRIGMVIGHEFTHGFDDMGSKFAADGNFKNWWSDLDRKAFEEKTTILGQTYSAFCPIDGHCVNPELTMGENIADLGGITMAYYAYMKTEEFKSGIKKNGFTPAQRFFISFAQLWKINYTNEEMKNRIANDPHSPGMYRVNGPLMNCPEFFEAFDIKEGDKMRNSNSKVARIW
jgi:putative endopeptidase